MKRSKIAGLGYYVPSRVVTNHDLVQIMNTTHEWIVERTGILERRYVSEEDKNYTMAAQASKTALERAGISPYELELIVYATLSPDYQFPGSGVLLQRELKCRTIPAIDIRAQCSGFVYALSVADQFIRTGMYQNALVVGSEIHSYGLDYSDYGRHIAVIFGDGAGAAVLKATDNLQEGILSTHLHSDGEFAEKLALLSPSFSCKPPRITEEMLSPGGSFYPVMDGPFVFKNATQRFCEVILEALQANQLRVEDIDLLVPHQANLRISQAIQKQLGLPDSKVFNNIQKYGNTTAASIPIALTEAWEAGNIKDGDLVCLAAFGSGFTWASALIRW
ncbi:MAG: ketoacyl-ACP synthase III [Cytophagales bacterium]|nr:ketoacyl-ACP synthase III [Cytophagales bacterium]MDW8384666.1 beta-ketoacyl-ACP synthase III [Flammeovirgaceae bacterium]